MDILPSLIGTSTDEIHGQSHVIRGIASVLHFDVRDGIFVSQHSPEDIRSIFEPDRTYDIHLMVANPFDYIQQLPSAQIRYCFVHVEIDSMRLEESLRAIHERNIKAGIALKLETPLEKVAELERHIKAVLVMSIVPGPSGNPFQASVVKRIDFLKDHFSHLYLCVDGGINKETITRIKHADGAVVHSALFKNDRPVAQLYQELCQLAV